MLGTSVGTLWFRDGAFGFVFIGVVIAVTIGIPDKSPGAARSGAATSSLTCRLLPIANWPLLCSLESVAGERKDRKCW